MGLPQPPSDMSPQKCEQSQPLDLRTNHNCACKFPPFQKRRYWFYQNEPLDLRIRHIGTSFHSVASENQETNAFIETETQSYVPQSNQEKIPSAHQFKKVFSKCHPNENTSNTQYTSKSSTCALFPFDLTDKNNQTIVSEDDINAENTSESVTCARISSNLPIKGIEKSSVGRQDFLTLKSLTVKDCYYRSNETRSEHLTGTITNIPLLLENNELEKSPINTDNLLVNKYNRDSSSKYLHPVETSNYKNNKTKRESKSKVENESPVSIMANNQELAVKVCEEDINKIEFFKDKVETGVHSIGENREQDEEPSPKRLRFESSVPPLQNPFTKPNVKQLKKTGESFLQDGKCFEVAPKLPRCRECSVALKDSLGKAQLGSDNVLCRFYAFRKLRYSTKGFLATAGFLDPHSDITQEDLRLWQPKSDKPLPGLDLQMARFMLTHVGDQFCALCKQEDEAVSIHLSEDKKASWKRPVPGCREMCDVCNTTLFNFHWTCRTCGFAVCIDCYKARKGILPKGVTIERPWLICVNKRAHDQDKMMLTQIIAADSLEHLGQKAHDIRTSLGLPLHCCGCPSSLRKTSTTSQSENTLSEIPAKEINIDSEAFDTNLKDKEDLTKKIIHPDSVGDTTNHLTSKTNNRQQTNNRMVAFEDFCSDTANYMARVFSSLRMRLTKPALNNSIPCHVPSNKYATENNITHENVIEEVILAVFDQAADDDLDTTAVPQAKPLVDRHGGPPQLRGGLIPTRVMTLTESRLLYPDCPHSWLCAGRLLKLSDPSHARNYTVFQDQWKRGQPVLVSGVLKFLDEGLWQPDSFIKDFGDTKNDLVNCMTGRVIPGQYMRKFWEGFQEVSKMLKDEKGNPMLLKLKDWPPGEDFAEMLPSRFEDLMKALPMGDYTKRTGQLNLPSRLPSSFARPDLGPKMYIAYGSAIHPTKGTTNLHLDISDAVNVMVYVGIPKDIDSKKFINEAYRAVDEACFEILMRRRVREATEVPGALWHIYSARDADKIRHLLTRVARERRIKLGPNQDPIHDQNWYLDAALRERLYKEYDVLGYAIVQCLGDAIFIPAGAPHQVRNLLNCIKVAEDFVSPENVSHCLHLTQEFRKLSEFHSNHEDKLQIKNIIYHAVKDSVSVLSQ